MQGFFVFIYSYKYGKGAFIFLPHFIRMVFHFETLNKQNETLNETLKTMLPNDIKIKVLNRYFMILIALKRKNHNTKELMELTKVSRSTIKRDLDVLEEFNLVLKPA